MANKPTMLHMSVSKQITKYIFMTRLHTSLYNYNMYVIKHSNTSVATYIRMYIVILYQTAEKIFYYKSLKQDMKK